MMFCCKNYNYLQVAATVSLAEVSEMEAGRRNMMRSGCKVLPFLKSIFDVALNSHDLPAARGGDLSPPTVTPCCLPLPRKPGDGGKQNASCPPSPTPPSFFTPPSSSTPNAEQGRLLTQLQVCVCVRARPRVRVYTLNHTSVCTQTHTCVFVCVCVCVCV